MVVFFMSRRMVCALVSYCRKYEVDQPLAHVSDAESWTLSVEPLMRRENIQLAFIVFWY